MRSLHIVVLILSLASPAFACTELQRVAAADLATPVPNEPTGERNCESVQVDFGARTLVGVAFLDAQGPGFAVLEAATEPRVIFATRESGMPPVNPQVRAQDLTGDGIPEFVAAFMYASSAVSREVRCGQGDARRVALRMCSFAVR